MADTKLTPPGRRRRSKVSVVTVGPQARRRAIGRGPAQARGHSVTQDEWLTVDEVCAELNIGRRTFERWRTLGIAPRATRPTRNGPLRIKRSWLDEWAEEGAT
jgi:excisionase family DNA binding protein